MSNTLTFTEILDLCPKSLNFFTNSSGPDLLVVSSLLRELKHLHKLVEEEKVDKNEIFLFVNQDFSMSISKYIRYYNSELAKTFPIDFLPGIYKDGIQQPGQTFAIINAPSTHINYFKLTAETQRQRIFRLQDVLKTKMPDLTVETKYKFDNTWWQQQISKHFTVIKYD